jgi:hypothetical protein
MNTIFQKPKSTVKLKSQANANRRWSAEWIKQTEAIKTQPLVRISSKSDSKMVYRWWEN